MVAGRKGGASKLRDMHQQFLPIAGHDCRPADELE